MKILAKERLSAHKYKDNNGYLICTDCILSRTGKQTYRRNEVFHDGSNEEIEVDRLEDEVFSNNALASFENVPICIEHPDEDVNPENHNDLSVGFVRNVRRGNYEGNDVMIADLVITDARAIDLVESGEMCELSCGYDCDIQDEENPQQRNIRGNHVALCEQGRAGIAKIIDSVNDAEPDEFHYLNKIIKYYEDNVLYKYKVDSMWFRTLDDAEKYIRNMKDSVNDAEFDPSKKGIWTITYFMPITKEKGKIDIIGPINEKEAIKEFKDIYKYYEIRTISHSAPRNFDSLDSVNDISKAKEIEYKIDGLRNKAQILEIEKDIQKALDNKEIDGRDGLWLMQYLVDVMKRRGLRDSESTSERNKIIEERNMKDKTQMTRYGKYFIVEVGDEFFINTSLGNYVTKAKTIEEAKRKIDLMDSVKDYTTYHFGEREYPSKVNHGEYDPHTGKFEDGTTYDTLKESEFKDSINDDKKINYLGHKIEKVFTTRNDGHYEVDGKGYFSTIEEAESYVKKMKTSTHDDIITRNGRAYKVVAKGHTRSGEMVYVVKNDGMFDILDADGNEKESGIYSLNEAIQIVKQMRDSVKDETIYYHNYIIKYDEKTQKYHFDGHDFDTFREVKEHIDGPQPRDSVKDDCYGDMWIHFKTASQAKYDQEIYSLLESTNGIDGIEPLEKKFYVYGNKSALEKARNQIINKKWANSSQFSSIKCEDSVKDYSHEDDNNLSKFKSMTKVVKVVSMLNKDSKKVKDDNGVFDIVVSKNISKSKLAEIESVAKKYGLSVKYSSYIGTSGKEYLRINVVGDFSKVLEFEHDGYARKFENYGLKNGGYSLFKK